MRQSNPGTIDEPLCRSRIALRFIRATKKMVSLPATVRDDAAQPQGLVVVVMVLIALLAALGAALALVMVGSARTRRQHDPVEYYRGWSGYRHPIHLDNQITREEAEAIGAAGAAYLIGSFDADGRLTRVVKMMRGEVFFEYDYTYYPNGKRRGATIRRGGRMTVLEYDSRGRGRSGRSAF